MGLIPSSAPQTTPDPTQATAPQAQAPAAAASPAQTPAQVAQTPAQATAPASAATPTPSTTTSGMPGVPEQATASVSDAHPTSVLRGILMGALGAAAKVGKGIEKVGEATSYGGAIRQRADAHTAAVTANQGAIAKQGQEATAAKEATVKSGDEHLESAARLNYTTNMGIGAALQNSVTQENLTQTQHENRIKNNEEDANTIRVLRDAGVTVNEEHGPGFDNLNPSHATDLVQAKTVAINNGQVGPNHGIALVDANEANQTPLTKDTPVVDGVTVDPKTGAMTDHKITLQAGNNSVGDILKAYHGYLRDRAEKLVTSDAIQKQRLNAADITAKGAEANKSNAEAKKANAEASMAGSFITPLNQNLSGDEFVKTLPAAMQSTIRSMMNYNMDYAALPRGKEKLPYINALTHADPTWSEPLYKQRHDYVTEYGSSTKGEGATRDRLNTAIQHLDLLGQAAQAVPQNNLQFLNKLAGDIGVATGKDALTVYNAIASKAAGELAGAIKGGNGSATDQEIDKALMAFDAKMSPAQQLGNIRTQMQLLKGSTNTIHGHFMNTMGKTPEDFGQPVLFNNNADIMKRWTEGGGAAPTSFTTSDGKSYPANSDGTFTANGYNYRLAPDGKTSTLVGPATK